ncbi:MAG: hypothetical protein WCK42_07965 [Myxococcaceae bacterium]
MFYKKLSVVVFLISQIVFAGGEDILVEHSSSRKRDRKDREDCFEIQRKIKDILESMRSDLSNRQQFSSEVEALLVRYEECEDFVNFRKMKRLVESALDKPGSFHPSLMTQLSKMRSMSRSAMRESSLAPTLLVGDLSEARFSEPILLDESTVEAIPGTQIVEYDDENMTYKSSMSSK